MVLPTVREGTFSTSVSSIQKLPETFPMVTFLFLVITPGYVLTSEDLAIGNGRDYAMFVFLDLCYLIQYDIFLILSIYSQSSWFHFYLQLNNIP